jgi:hypothetical protein
MRMAPGLLDCSSADRYPLWNMTRCAQRGRQPRRHPVELKTQPEGPDSRLMAPPRQRRRLDAVLGGGGSDPSADRNLGGIPTLF